MAKPKSKMWAGHPVPEIRINIESAGTIGVDGSHTVTISGKPKTDNVASPVVRPYNYKNHRATCDHVIGFIKQAEAKSRINFDLVRLIHQNEIPEPPSKIGGGYLVVTLWHCCPNCGKELKEIQPKKSLKRILDECQILR